MNPPPRSSRRRHPLACGPAIASPKTLLRAEMRARRRALAAAAPDAAQRAAARLPKDLLGRFAVVSGYRPQGAELDAGPLMQQLAQAGARLALPAIVEDQAQSPARQGGGGSLAFRLHETAIPLEPDFLGILSPPRDAEETYPDLIIVPLVAFDTSGHRLGQGGGYYDRAIAALRARKTVFVLGLAYAGQEVLSVPTDPHDQRLDAILTEKGYIPVPEDI